MNNGTAKKPVLKKVTSKSIDTDSSFDDDVPFTANVDTADSTSVQVSDRAYDEVDPVAVEYVGRWNRVVSTSNWEKGRIICEWRERAIAESLDVLMYSDEAWARKVEHVSPQHVGRLRRVYARFANDYESYNKLFWSHFLAALEWDDAAMWLEGASQSGWSVSQMRHQRWQAMGGKPDAEPQSNDIIASEYDDGFEPVTAIEDEQSIGDEDDDRIVSGPLNEGPDFGDEGEVNSENVAAAEDDVAVPVLAQENPFLGLPPMPEDVADAVEQMKLAIVRHRCRSWEEFPQTHMSQVIDALRKFAMQSNEG